MPEFNSHKSTTGDRGASAISPALTLQPGMAGAAEFHRQAVVGWMEMNRECTSFLTRRLQEDAALVHRLATCARLQEVYGIYAEFVQRCLSDYQSEFITVLRSCNPRQSNVPA